MAPGRPWRWRRFVRRDAAGEFDEELAFHLEQRIQDYVARGLDPESARRAALARMGDVACAQ